MVVEGMRVHIERHLEWEVWGLTQERILVLGRESYPQFVYAIVVRPHVLETDPGPLDARVP